MSNNPDIDAEVENAVIAIATRLGGQVLATLRAILALVILVSFGAGVFVTDLRGKVVGLTAAVHELKANIAPKAWLEEQLGDIELEQRRLQRQIDRLESAVFDGKRKPPLDSYVDNGRH